MNSKENINIIYVATEAEKTEEGYANAAATNGSGIYISQIQQMINKEKKTFTVRWEKENEDWSQADFIVFVDFFRKPLLLLEKYCQICKSGYISKTVYLMQEPESVIPQHSRVSFILKFFHFVLTYNDDIVDNKRVFKLPIPYNFSNNFLEYQNYNQKTMLLTNVSGYHKAQGKRELYSERLKVIQYFEDKHPEDFAFFGTKWPQNVYKCYKGATENKCKTYQNFRFALCLENTCGVNGYITEKILDCFKARIVPIYKGAPNIDEIIPAESYINYDQFDNLEQMYLYLKEMTFETYDRYIQEANQFMQSGEESYFGTKYYVNCLDKFCQYVNIDSNFRVGKIKLFYLRLLKKYYM